MTVSTKAAVLKKAVVPTMAVVLTKPDAESELSKSNLKEPAQYAGSYFHVQVYTGNFTKIPWHESPCAPSHIPPLLRVELVCTPDCITSARIG